MHASGAINHILSTCCAARDYGDDEGQKTRRIGYYRVKNAKRNASAREASAKQNASNK